MTMRKAQGNIIGAAALCLISWTSTGCDGDTTAPAEPGQAAPAQAAKQGTVTMQVLRGDAELLIGGRWQAAAAGASHEATGARSTSGGVAELTVGDRAEPASLWLRSDSEITLQADTAGTWQIAAQRGEARLALPPGQPAVFGDKEMTGQDVLLEPGKMQRTAAAVMHAD